MGVNDEINSYTAADFDFTYDINSSPHNRFDGGFRLARESRASDNLSPEEYTALLRGIHLKETQTQTSYRVYGKLVSDTKRLISEIHESSARIKKKAEERQEDCMDRFFLHECNGQCKDCDLGKGGKS